MRASEEQPDAGRRGFVKRALYVPPAVLTLTAAPAFAKAGSEKPWKMREHPTHPKSPGKGKGRGLEKKSLHSKRYR